MVGGVGVGGSTPPRISRRRRSAFWWLFAEQPSFGVDGDVPPDALLDFAAAEKVGRREEEEEGRFDREEDERDFEALKRTRTTTSN